MARRKRRQIPGQLPMFMTAGEIKASRKPLIFDQMEVDDPVSGISRYETDDELWNRKLEESKEPPDVYRKAIHGDTGNSTEDSFIEQIYRGDVTGQPEYRTGNTDQYEKAHESWYNRKYSEFAEGRKKPQRSLYESIAESGVSMPVRLGPTMVTGGHHRIAAAHHINPDMFLPVLHEGVDVPVRNSPGYPYT